ncbi:MAG: DJ-1/PfpI family protein, partial [Pyrinomonadaceae bacterium]
HRWNKQSPVPEDSWHFGTFTVKTVGLLDSGLRVTPAMTLDELKATNSVMLVLPGGTAWDKKKNKEAVQLAVEFLAKGVPVAAICGATAGLARVGLLDKVPHTSNSKDYHRSDWL